jgi:hypothetical protein
VFFAGYDHWQRQMNLKSTKEVSWRHKIIVSETG